MIFFTLNPWAFLARELIDCTNTMYTLCNCEPQNYSAVLFTIFEQFVYLQEFSSVFEFLH